VAAVPGDVSPTPLKKNGNKTHLPLLYPLSYECLGFTLKDKQTAFSALEFCSKVAEGPVSNVGTKIRRALQTNPLARIFDRAYIYTGFQQQTLDSQADHSVNVSADKRKHDTGKSR
jgi:hypothetical protein